RIADVVPVEGLQLIDGARQARLHAIEQTHGVTPLPLASPGVVMRTLSSKRLRSWSVAPAAVVAPCTAETCRRLESANHSESSSARIKAETRLFDSAMPWMATVVSSEDRLL